MSEGHPLYRSKPECCMATEERKAYELRCEKYHKGEFGKDQPSWWKERWDDK